MNLDKRAIIKLSVVLLTLLICFGITPLQTKQFFDLKKNIKKLREDISKIQEDVNTKPKIISDATALETSITEITSKIIDYRDVSSLQAFISSTAKKDAIDIVETGSAPPIPYKKIGKNSYVNIPLTLTLRAGYHDLGRFIAEIEQGPYPLRVKNLQITTNKPLHDVTLSITIITKDQT